MVVSNADPSETSNELQREVIGINRQNADTIAQPRNPLLFGPETPVLAGEGGLNETATLIPPF